MLGVTIIFSHSHVDSQALGEVHHTLLMCCCVSSFQILRGSKFQNLTPWYHPLQSLKIVEKVMGGKFVISAFKHLENRLDEHY